MTVPKYTFLLLMNRKIWVFLHRSGNVGFRVYHTVAIVFFEELTSHLTVPFVSFVVVVVFLVCFFKFTIITIRLAEYSENELLIGNIFNKHWIWWNLKTFGVRDEIEKSTFHLSYTRPYIIWLVYIVSLTRLVFYSYFHVKSC